MKLTAVSYQSAVDFLKKEARPLEAALFAHEFEGGEAEVAIRALAAFQNEDGGYGHALEPDVQTAVSSVLATTVALQILRLLRVNSSHPQVQGAMRFLVAHYDPEKKRWPMLPPEAEASPRAPWWNGVGLGEGFGGFLINPRVEIIGYLWAHAPLVPERLREEATTAALDHLAAQDGPLEMHDLYCLQRLIETAAFPAAMKTAVRTRFEQDARAQIAQNPEAWQGYSLQPLDLIASPTAPLFSEMEAAVWANLTFMMGQQQADGAWHPAWSWGEQFADTWPKAKQAWSGVLTLNKLRVLRNFGKLP